MESAAAIVLIGLIKRSPIARAVRWLSVLMAMGGVDPEMLRGGTRGEGQGGCTHQKRLSIASRGKAQWPLPARIFEM